MLNDICSIPLKIYGAFKKDATVGAKSLFVQLSLASQINGWIVRDLFFRNTSQYFQLEIGFYL